MLEPKFRRPGKPGHIWPGVYRIPQSYQNQTHPWHFACPAPLCFYQGSYTSQGAANKIQETHTCPWFGGGKTTISWGIMSDMFVAPIWEKLDEVVDDLMEENCQELAGKARGLAEALAVLMPPFFATGDEIAAEAMVRWEKRQAGEEYETPGVGRLRFKVPPGAEVMTPAGIPHAMAIGTKSAPEYHPATASKSMGLPQAKVDAILAGLRSGFDSRMMAMAHETTEAMVKAIARAHGQA